MDWLEIFKGLIEAELKYLKEELFKEKSALLKSMVGPPLTMLLMAEGLLTVQQEMEAGFLETSIFQDKTIPENKKRKYESDLVQKGQETGESSFMNGTTTKVLPEVTVAIATPATGTADTHLSSKALEDILVRFNKTNSCMEQNLQTWTTLLSKEQRIFFIAGS